MDKPDDLSETWCDTCESTLRFCRCKDQRRRMLRELVLASLKRRSKEHPKRSCATRHVIEFMVMHENNIKEHEVRRACRALEQEGLIENRGRAVAGWRYVSPAEKRKLTISRRKQAEKAERADAIEGVLKLRKVKYERLWNDNFSFSPEAIDELFKIGHILLKKGA